MSRTLRIASIPAHIPFLDQLAARWSEAAGGDAERIGLGTIILPGRRAARALSEAFLRQADGRAILLPRIVPIGGIDEAETAFAGGDALLLPPAVAPMRRLAVLTRLVLQAEGAFGTRPTLDQAWPLARALATLMDEAEWADVDLSTALHGAVEEGFAEHWRVTLRFLEIVTAMWPAWLQEQQEMNPVARQVALLRAQAAHWAAPSSRQDENAEPLWAAGFSDAMPATADALRGVLSHPMGRVILPGLDMAMADEVFAALPDGHPQAGLSRLLADLDATRGDVDIWDTRGASSETATTARRVALLSRALLPAAALSDWAADSNTQGGARPADLFKLSTADQQEEASSIALALRAALEKPGLRAALITPDRALAGRVATELARWGVMADDSAGESLIASPSAVLLRLLAQAMEARFAPVALLALLKHPLVGCGITVGACRASVRLMERRILRGPAPAPGFAGLRARAQTVQEGEDDPGASADRPDQPRPLHAFIDLLETCLAPMIALEKSGTRPVPDLLSALLSAAEALAATDLLSGQERLWGGEEGNVLARTLGELFAASAVLPEQPPAVLDGLLSAVLAEERVPGRRALRGRDGAALHPRLFIWGLVEARLQQADLVILGGLVEGVWPQATDPGPWLSRPMRASVGLPSPERAIGQAAHDFVSCAASATEVILSCPGRRDGAPAVPARWLVRLDAFLAGGGGGVGAGYRLPEHPALGWWRQLDRPDGAPRAAAPPAPRPAVALRPRRLSVTEIETWIRDPYAIYARHVLRLRPLPELEESVDASNYGTIVHAALDAWFRAHGTSWPGNAEAGLRAAFLKALEEADLRPALAAWWRPRLARIAGWVAQAEAARREASPSVTIRTEIPGAVDIPDMPGGTFRLTGRADRIDIGADGLAAILDYKTGQVPGSSAVVAGWNPQLPLEAAMLARGGFPNVPVSYTDESLIASLVYWQLTGGAEPGKSVAIAPKDRTLDLLAEEAWARLLDRILEFDDPEQPYLSHPHPGKEPRFADYAQLARVAEWSTARDEG